MLNKHWKWYQTGRLYGSHCHCKRIFMSHFWTSRRASSIQPRVVGTIQNGSHTQYLKLHNESWFTHTLHSMGEPWSDLQGTCSTWYYKKDDNIWPLSSFVLHCISVWFSCCSSPSVSQISPWHSLPTLPVHQQLQLPDCEEQISKLCRCLQCLLFKWKYNTSIV